MVWCLNSLRLSGVYMHQCNITTVATWVQIMACWLLGAKPSSEPMLPFFFSIKPQRTYFMKLKSFHSRKCTSKYCLPKQQPFTASLCQAYNSLNFNGDLAELCFVSSVPGIHTQFLLQNYFPRNNNVNSWIDDADIELVGVHNSLKQFYHWGKIYRQVSL